MRKHHENHPDKNPGSESEANKPTCDWGHVRKKTFHDLLHGSWATNIWAGVAVALVWPCLALLMNSPKGMVIGAGVGLTMLLWIIVMAVWRNVGEQPPTLAPETEESADARHQKQMAMLQEMMAEIKKDRAAEFAAKYPLGCAIFSVRKHEVIPFNDPSGSIVADWSAIKVTTEDMEHGEAITVAMRSAKVGPLLVTNVRMTNFNKAGMRHLILLANDVGLWIEIVEVEKGITIAVLGLQAAKK